MRTQSFGGGLRCVVYVRHLFCLLTRAFSSFFRIDQNYKISDRSGSDEVPPILTFRIRRAALVARGVIFPRPTANAPDFIKPCWPPPPRLPRPKRRPRKCPSPPRPVRLEHRRRRPIRASWRGPAERAKARRRRIPDVSR